MPTYDYRCKDCAHEFEIVQSIKDDALTVCPECNGVLSKKFSAVGISFRGSGFYKNDSRSNSSQSEKKTESNTSSTNSTGTVGSSESTKTEAPKTPASTTPTT